MLLKNTGKTLPLTRRGTKKSGMKLLVAGRNANATSNMQGNYFGTAPYLISPCQGLAAYADVRCRSTTICGSTTPRPRKHRRFTNSMKARRCMIMIF